MEMRESDMWPSKPKNPGTISTERLRGIVAEHMPALIKRLALQNWEITIRFGPTPDPKWAMTIDRESAYNLATITLDASKIRDGNHALKCLLHELIHIVLAPMDLFFAMTREHHSQELDAAWNYALEQTIVGIEQGLAQDIVAKPESGRAIEDTEYSNGRTWDAIRYVPNRDVEVVAVPSARLEALRAAPSVNPYASLDEDEE